MTPPLIPRLAAVALAVLVPALAPAARAQSPAADSARIARVERGLLPAVQVRGRTYAPATIEERLRHHRVPAVSVAVIHDGKLAWARAYGMADPATQRPATTGTLFQAASMSKPVAAMAALRLVQDGRLALDEDVNATLVSWKVPGNELTATSPVTLRTLLTHSAGLTVHGFPGYAAGAPVPTVVQLLDGAPPANTAPVRVDVAPGTRWRYSGGGTTVMQLLLQDVTSTPFPALMRRTVLDPIGMTASTYAQPLPDSLADRAAVGHRANGTPVAGRWHTYPEMAAAGLWTTPSDLARWILEVQQSLAGRSNRVLSKATTEAMLTRGVGGWGLGPALRFLDDSLVFEHGGANEGYRGEFLGFAHRGEGAVVLTNSDAGSQLAREIVLALAREYGWTGYAPREIVPIAVTAEALREYAGRYALPGGSQHVHIAVAADGASLVATLPAGDTRELVPTGKDAFADITGSGGVAFERGGDGTITTLVAGATRMARVP